MSECDQEIHQFDVGTIFRFLLTDCGTPADVSTATSLAICFLKPDQTVLTKTATFTNVGTDGLIQYTTVPGDIDQVGGWQWQGVVAFPGGSIFHSAVREFEVFTNICTPFG